MSQFYSISPIKEIIHLLDFSHTNPEILLEQLDTLLIAAKNELTEDHVFSRESFRTFIEAHNLVKEVLDRRKRTLQSTIFKDCK